MQGLHSTTRARFCPQSPIHVLPSREAVVTDLSSLALTVLATALCMTLVPDPGQPALGSRSSPRPLAVRSGASLRPAHRRALLLLLASGIPAWAGCLLLPAFPRVHSPGKSEVNKNSWATVFSPLASSSQSPGTGARLPELMIHYAHVVFISSQCCAVGIQQKYNTFNWERNGRLQAATATGKDL